MSLAGELQDITAMWVTPPLSRAAGTACVFHNRFSSAGVHLSSSIPNLQRLGLRLVAEQDCHTRASHLPTASTVWFDGVNPDGWKRCSTKMPRLFHLPPM